MIFQDPYQTLNPRQRVRTLVAEPLVVQGVDKSVHDDRVRQALEDVGLEYDRFSERYPFQLSGGQRQRVAIAAALVLEPEGLICDEPVSMLDVSVQAQILAVLLELQRRRELALLFITHDLSLAWTLCDRIAVMYLGRVVEQGSAVDVIERPQHPYTQALVERDSGAGGGRRRRTRAAHRRAARRHQRSHGLSLSPALSEAVRALRPRRPAAARRRTARDSSPPACSTTRPWAARRAMRPVTVGAERWRDIAGPVGRIEPGQRNAITDVPGVRVGQSQASSGEPTGVTVVAPPSLPVPAGTAVVNGMGELTGKIEIDERGTLTTPVYLCGSHAVGAVHHAAVLASGRGPGDIVLPVVGECDDSWRADSRTVVTGDVERAFESLGTEVAEGTVGAGTGMMCFEFPGGIGTASRAVGEHHVGVLLLCNFGDRERLDLLGTHLDPAEEEAAPAGSCITVCATDAPMGPQHLRRLALRPLLGLARVGSYAAEGSGEIGLAFTTAEPATLANDELDPYFAAAWEAAQEAVYNCLVAARPGKMRDGTMQDEFPIELVRELARARDGDG